MNEMPRYRVRKLYDEHGQVAPHFLDDEFRTYSTSWEEAMADPHFAEIIQRDLAAERMADDPLDRLARLAPNDRVRSRFLAWLRFMDTQLEPWTTGGAIHFRPHWARTLMLALTMGDAAGLSDSDLDALAAAAVFHDSRRKNPYLDTGHGDRAASYYASRCAAAASSNGNTAPLHFDPRAYLAMQWHDRDDADGLRVIAAANDRDELPTASDSRRKRAPLEKTSDAFRGMQNAQLLTPNGLKASLPGDADADAATIYRLFKDADGLDRIRLGSNGLDPKFLRFQYAHDALPLARELLAESERE